MEKIVSTNVVPEAYIFPEGQRPNIELVTTCERIPIIDFGGGSEEEVSREILKAGKEFGFFQVINHGIPEEVTNNMMKVAEEFFEMPFEDKASYYSDDPKVYPRFFTGQGFGKGETRYWRDVFVISSYPVEKFEHLFPEKPPNFRNTISKLTPEAKGLATKILKLISIGLGLDEYYLTGNLSGGQINMVLNYYPPCPDPALTLGLPKHCDPNLITLLLQGKVSGLEVLYDGKWVAIEPLPNAFVVNFGLLFEVVTNGMLKAVEHRAVTNPNAARTSIVLNIRSTDDYVICPAQALINKDDNPPLYKSFLFSEFFKKFSTTNNKDKDNMMEEFRIKY